MSEQYHEEDDTLGPCGCVDYHMADCPLRSNLPDVGVEWGLDEDDRFQF